jgi:enoyl-CoA hydratase/carnithine racemase
MDHFKISRDGPVQTIEMSWTAARPGFQLESFVEATNSLKEADTNSDIACTVFLGVPRCFCLGTDASIFGQTNDLKVLSDTVLKFFRALVNSKKPLIAGVDGTAVGLGMTMLLHFDAIFATPESVFKAPFVEWGLSPEAAASILLPESIGYRKSFEMFCLGGQLSAADAEHRGLITRTVPSNELHSVVQKTARQLAALPQRPLRATRELMRQQRDKLIRQARFENVLFQDLLEDLGTQRRLKAMARASRIALSDTKRNRDTRSVSIFAAE